MCTRFETKFKFKFKPRREEERKQKNKKKKNKKLTWAGLHQFGPLPLPQRAAHTYTAGAHLRLGPTFQPLSHLTLALSSVTAMWDRAVSPSHRALRVLSAPLSAPCV